MAAAVKAVRNKKRHEREAREEQLEQVPAIFERYDAGSGLAKEELIDALRDVGLDKLGPGTDDAIASALIDRYSYSNSASELSLEQFRHIVASLQKDPSPTRSVQKLFYCQFCRHLPTWRGHERASVIYTNKWTQTIVAFLIVGNFVVNCVEKEIDPFPAEMQQHLPMWDTFDIVFNALFLMELILNIWGCGGPYRKFWSSGWNIFDFFIVTVGVVLMMNILPPDSPLSNLKMLRAFRVFRLFKRVKSLNKIVSALISAIPGVLNAFVVMVIFMMIYAILAVEYFGPVGQEFGRDGFGMYVTFDEDGLTHNISAITERGFVYGWEYYGSFFRALYTLFQVMTGESWSEVVARPLLFGFGTSSSVFIAIYFVSFILLTQIVLTNVVVAVLLDKFVEDSGGDDSATPPSDSEGPRQLSTGVKRKKGKRQRPPRPPEPTGTISSGTNPADRLGVGAMLKLQSTAGPELTFVFEQLSNQMKESQRRAEEQSLELRRAIAQIQADAKEHEASVTEALVELTSLVSRALGGGGALQPSTAERGSTSFTASGGSTLPPSRTLPSEKPRGASAGAPLASRRSLSRVLLASRSQRKLRHKPDVHFAADVENVTEAVCAQPVEYPSHPLPVEHPSHPLRERPLDEKHDAQSEITDTNHAQSGSSLPGWLSSLGNLCQASPESQSRSQHLSAPSTPATSSSSDNYVA